MTVNSLTATRYNDATFAKEGFSLADGNNTFTAIAQDAVGRSDTNSVTIYLPASPSYSYDSNGNLLADGRRTFAYDDENQLTSIIVTNAGGSSTLTTNIYDGLFRRRIRKEFSWVNGAWAPAGEVRYVYDGRLVAQERDGNNVALISYTRGTDLSGSREGAGGIGGLLARTDNGQLNTGNGQPHAFYHADGNGNVTALVILSKSGLLRDDNTYRFSSKEYHQSSGLVCYLYRFYDPNLQRWINRDPLGEPGGLNLNQFAANDPVDLIDPDGLAPQLGTIIFDPKTGKASCYYTGDSPSARSPRKVPPQISLDSVRDAIQGVLSLPHTLRQQFLPDGVNDFLDDLGEMLDPDAPDGTVIAAAPPLGLKPVGPRGGFRNASDERRIEAQLDRRRLRRERASRKDSGQNQSGEGFRDHASADKGPSGERPGGRACRDKRERNVGIDEEHSRVPKGSGGMPKR